VIRENRQSKTAQTWLS